MLTGNHKLYTIAENLISAFHNSESVLIFNSGYDANVGFFQCVPQRGDLIIYDEYIHASIRDGIQLSFAQGYKFKHNDLADLKKLIKRLRSLNHLDDIGNTAEIYLVTESVFSMDGDSPDLQAMADLCEKHNIHFIVDEAHATGVVGAKGEGLVAFLCLEAKVFARIVTFGKAMGAHGAAILGSKPLKEYLVNYARSFIYTTGLPPHSVAVLIATYEHLLKDSDYSEPYRGLEKLTKVIGYFQQALTTKGLENYFVESDAAIHCAMVPGVERVRSLSQKLLQNQMNVKPIVNPTVPKGQERLRICLHAYNTEEEIDKLLDLLKEILQK